MIIAFDLSLSTGVAWGGESDPGPRTALFPLPEGEHNYDRALKIMRDTAMMLCRFHKAEIVAVEAAMQKVDRGHSAYAAFLLISLQAVVREAATQYGARVIPVSVQEWRRSLLGNGNMPGPEAKRASMKLCDRMAWSYGGNDDRAEAAMIWWHVIAGNCKKWQPGRMDLSR